MAWLMGGGIFGILISIVVGFLFFMAPLMIWHNTSATRAQTKKLNATMLRIETLLGGKSVAPIVKEPETKTSWTHEKVTIEDVKQTIQKFRSKLAPRKKEFIPCPACGENISGLVFKNGEANCPHCGQILAQT